MCADDCPPSTSKLPPTSDSVIADITTSDRHREIRLEADKNYRKNAEKMIEQFSKQKRHQVITYIGVNVGFFLIITLAVS